MHIEIPENIDPLYVFNSYVGCADVSIMGFHGLWALLPIVLRIHLPYWSGIV